MISVCMLGGAGGGDGQQLARYYRRGAACEHDQPHDLEHLPTPPADVPGLDEVPADVRAQALQYYAKAEQLAAARWVGDGAGEVGLTGAVTEAGMSRFASLLNGTLDGQQIARPVLRESRAGHLDLDTLLTALQAAADARGVAVADLFDSPAARQTYDGVMRRAGDGRDWIRPETALELCMAAGLDVSGVYLSKDGVDRFREAESHSLEREDVRRVGVDVTVSAPKSVSTLAAVTTNQGAVEAIMRCHTLATNEALGYLQRHAGHAFRGHHGDGQQMSTIGTAGWIGAAFTHHTSRADDPQLHTHLVIANVLHGDDGKWSAVDSRAVFRHAKTAGYLYQAALRHHLSRELGVSWTSTVKGVAEIEGIPQEVLREFSTRRRDILTALSGTTDRPAPAATPPTRESGRLTRGRRRALQAATLATRPGKTHQRPEQLRQSWRDRAARAGLPSVEHLLHPGRTAPQLPALGPDLGLGPEPVRLIERLRGRAPHPAPTPVPTPAAAPAATPAPGVDARHHGPAEQPDLERLAAELFGPTGLTERKTDFDTRDVVQALCEALPPDACGDALTVEWLAARLLDHPLALRLEAEAGSERGPVYSSRDLVTTEHRAITLASRATRAPTADKVALAAALHDVGQGLSLEQRTAVIQLAVDPRLATALVGPAGSGKTATLATLHAYWRGQQRPVVGVALAALTAQRLQADSGIPSSSLAALLHQLDTPDPTTGQARTLPAGAVVVVDEAGMVGTRDLTRLFQRAHDVGGQVLLVGDPAQLGEIDVGGLFRHLAAPAMRPAELTANQRQTHPWEQQALLDLRHGRVRTAIDAYAANDRIRTAPDRDQLLQQLASDYLSSDRSQTVVLAVRRDDVATLNTLIRQGLQDAKALPADAVVLRDTDGRALPLAVGDQMLNTRNLTTAAGARLLNGTRLTVTAASSNSVMVTDTDGVTQHVLDSTTASATLRHAFATTVHKAQGVTVDQALVLADDLSAHAAYTALSRGRDSNILYRTSDTDPRAELVKDLAARDGDQLALTRLAPAPSPARSPQLRGLGLSRDHRQREPDRGHGLER